jgi:hypothetical protein
VTDVRWVAYHATRGANGEREDRRAGEFNAPDKVAAERHARAVYGPTILVQSRLSWDLAAAERLELARQRERERGVGKPKFYGKSQGRARS